LVNAKEKKSFFGFGGEGQCAHLGASRWLDQAQADPAANRYRTGPSSLRPRSACLAPAARRRDATSAKGAGRKKKATVDLKPFASNAQRKNRRP